MIAEMVNWSRSLDPDYKKHIRLKSMLWKKFINTRANRDYLECMPKRQRNILMSLVGKGLMDKQNGIALIIFLKKYRNIPKCLWNYICEK